MKARLDPRLCRLPNLQLNTKLLILITAAIAVAGHEVPSRRHGLDVLEARLRPAKWNVSAATPAFWRNRHDRLVVPGHAFFPIKGDLHGNFYERRVVLNSLVINPPPRFSTHSFTRIGFDATLARLAMFVHEAIQRLPVDEFLHHVRDNRFGGPSSRDDVLDVCGRKSAFGRTVDPTNESNAVREARSALKELVRHATALAGEKYRDFLIERRGIKRIEDRSDLNNPENAIKVRLECEEVFASHTAVDTVVGHLDTANMGPGMTIAIWLPLNPVLSYPLVIGGGVHGGGHGWTSLGLSHASVFVEDEMWSTHGLVEGEGLAYLAPEPPFSSAMHGSAALPTDIYPDDINPPETYDDDGNIRDFHPSRLDPAITQLRHRLIIVARVVRE